MLRRRVAPFVILVVALVGPAAAQRIQVTNYGEMEPVLFPHSEHAERFHCDTCHHPERSEGSHRCGACHRATPEGGTPSMEQAAHGEGDVTGKCRPCHFGPKAKKALECEDCHSG
ncbi:cytochrome c3 family protein [Deferrisoma palaeochoriense]